MQTHPHAGYAISTRTDGGLERRLEAATLRLRATPQALRDETWAAAWGGVAYACDLLADGRRAKAGKVFAGVFRLRHPDEPAIYLDEAMTPERERITLCHELAHSIESHFGLDLPEEVVDAYGRGILYLIRHNPALVRYLQRQEPENETERTLHAGRADAVADRGASRPQERTDAGVAGEPEAPGR